MLLKYIFSMYWIEPVMLTGFACVEYWKGNQGVLNE